MAVCTLMLEKLYTILKLYLLLQGARDNQFFFQNDQNNEIFEIFKMFKINTWSNVYYTKRKHL